MIRILFCLLFCLIPILNFAQQKIGVASYYSAKFEGRKTASGDIFSNKKFTAASNHFKLGDRVKVTNIKSGKFVIVKINDRMAKNSSRLIDLSHEAAKSLCFMDKGLCQVKVEICSDNENETNLNAEISADSVVLDK